MPIVNNVARDFASKRNVARDFASKRGGERSSAQDYQVLGKCACERKRHRATFATSGERNASERIFSLFIS